MILVTGGHGYVGSFTLRLFKKGKALSVDNYSRGNNFAKKFSKNILVNIQNKKKISEIIKKYKIETIIHLASFTCVRESKAKPSIYKKNNLINQKIFFDNIIELGVKNIIFSSSYSVQGFDKKASRNFSPYAKYKFLIEKYLKIISKKNNVKVIVLRYPNIAGASSDGKLGEKNDKISRIFPTFYKNIYRNKKTIIYYDFKKKIFPSRNYIHVEDIARLNLLTSKYIKKMKKNFLLININNKKKFSNKQIFDLMSEKLKKGSYILKKISKYEKISPLYINNTFLLKKMMWRPKNSSIDKIINTNIKWFKKIYSN
mgnify:CR=1 FL=1